MFGESHNDSLTDAPPILSNVPGSFAWSVFHQRHPALVKHLRDSFPYPPDQRNELTRLEQETSAGVITPLTRDAHDYERWRGWGRGHFGHRWTDVPFLWAESYFYRRLLDAVGFFRPGPWAGIDPFGPLKNAELEGAGLGSELAVLDEVLSLPTTKRASALLHASRAHSFLCAPLSYHHMPADFATQFSSSFTIMKGDLNYRRLVGDCQWPATTPFRTLTRYFPGPVAVLRILKSDVVVGVPESILTALDSTAEQWRTNSKRALIQVRP